MACPRPKPRQSHSRRRSCPRGLAGFVSGEAACRRTAGVPRAAPGLLTPRTRTAPAHSPRTPSPPPPAALHPATSARVSPPPHRLLRPSCETPRELSPPPPSAPLPGRLTCGDGRPGLSPELSSSSSSSPSSPPPTQYAKAQRRAKAKGCFPPGWEAKADQMRTPEFSS